MEDARVGVFVCHCGTNIGGYLDVPALVEYSQTLPNVVFSMDNLYTCSEVGLEEIRKSIKEHGLNRVIVASCTPRTHEPLFRSTCEEAGLNPYLFEFVNIREQCSWVHMDDRENATNKAKDLIKMGVAKARLLEPEEEIEVEVHPSAVVIGGGIAGITSSLSLANRGFKVTLIEKEAHLGGLLKRLHKLYPTGEDASKTVKAKIKETERTPLIDVMTSSNVENIEGFIGNYNVTVKSGETERSIKAGVIIVAIGAEVLKPKGMYNYDGKKVVTQLELEEMLQNGNFNADRVVMIQCVGARNDERGYCSRVCCMTAIQNAMLIKETYPRTEVSILYRDMQTYGTRYEECYRSAREAGVLFIEFLKDRQPVVDDRTVKVFDEFLGEELTLPYDLVALSTPMIPQPGAENLAKMLKVPLDENGFFLEAHVKLRPVDFSTDGIYLCGSAHWPSDVSESISQAYAAASKASIPLSRGRVKAEPLVSVVDEEKCVGCGLCESVCPFKAIRVEQTEKGRVAKTIVASCKGCGVCGAGCPEKAISMQHFTDDQLLAQIDSLTEVKAIGSA